MSALTVSYCRIQCDACGVIAEETVAGATAARIRLSSQGWKFAEYDTRGLNKYETKPDQRRRIVPRQWDSCPNCDLPADALAASAIRDAQTATSKETSK